MAKQRRFVQVGPYECEVVKLARVYDQRGRRVPYHVRLDKGRVEIDRGEPDQDDLIRRAVGKAEAALAATMPAMRRGRLIPMVGWAESPLPRDAASASGGPAASV